MGWFLIILIWVAIACAAAPYAARHLRDRCR